jgi:membrane-bound serine protease (ClpP class)
MRSAFPRTPAGLISRKIQPDDGVKIANEHRAANIGLAQQYEQYGYRLLEHTMFRQKRIVGAGLAAAWCAIVLLAAWCVAVTAAAAVAPVTLLTIDGAIGPASADYVVRGIARAANNGSQLVVLQMDTPGGLDTSMRSIIRAILTSPVPVAGYVAPSGARAASAGTYILFACHVAAMAPGTNLGAATPVRIGTTPEPEPQRDQRNSEPRNKQQAGASPADSAANPAANPADGATPMARKEVNDAVAYIRELAHLRARNADWAERAVREAASLPAHDAMTQRVTDYIAADLRALLVQLDGKKFTVLGQVRQLQTRDAPIVDAGPDWRTRLLAAITNPGIALLLMTIGIYGLVFEFMNPGFGVPGVIGAISLLLGLYALQMLPVNYAGLALIVLGMAFMVAEAFLPSFGVIGVGGIAAFVAGALILIDTEVPGFGVPLALIVGLAVCSALILAGLAGIALKTRRRAVVGGPDAMIGSIAEMVDDAGWARMHGEIWRVRSHSPLRRAQAVRVVGRNGLVLEVVPAEQDEPGG